MRAFWKLGNVLLSHLYDIETCVAHVSRRLIFFLQYSLLLGKKWNQILISLCVSLACILSVYLVILEIVLCQYLLTIPKEGRYEII